MKFVPNTRTTLKFFRFYNLKIIPLSALNLIYISKNNIFYFFKKKHLQQDILKISTIKEIKVNLYTKIKKNNLFLFPWILVVLLNFINTLSNAKENNIFKTIVIITNIFCIIIYIFLILKLTSTSKV